MFRRSEHDKRPLQLHEKDIILLNIGRLTRQKGQMALVAAMNSLVEQDSRFKLLICGRGPLEKRIRAGISMAHLEGNVILPGFVDVTSVRPPSIPAIRSLSWLDYDPRQGDSFPLATAGGRAPE